MNASRRIKIWAMVFVISILFTVKEYNDNKPKPEKQPITAYVSAEFSVENADIEDNFNHSDLGETYSLKVSNTASEKNHFRITTNVDDISSVNYEVIGESPLIVIMKQDKENIKQFTKSGLLMCPDGIEMDKNDKVEINFQKLMDAVINKKNWSEFGGENKEIKVFYPELTTIEGERFKEFLFITANGGLYPTKKEEIESCQKYIDKFLAQSNVHGVNVMNRLTGVNDISTDIYITFENNVLQLDTENDYEEIIYVTYPTETVVKQVFFESVTEIGEQVMEILDESNGFLGIHSSIEYLICSKHRYRYGNGKVSENGIGGYVNFKDSYNSIEIP